LKIVIHPFFLITVAAALCVGLGIAVFFAVIAVLIHESSHALVANFYGIKVKKLTILPFGAEVNIDCAFLPPSKQIIILLAGSFGNITAAIVTSAFIWFLPELFPFIGMFILANIVPAFLNLLPIYPLDGGKIIWLLGGPRTTKVLKIISNVVFSALFFIGCFVTFNWVLIIFALCLLFTVNAEVRSCDYISRFLKTGKAKNGEVCEVAVNSTMTIFSAYKLVSSDKYTKFIITDMRNKPFYENELEEYLLRSALDTKILDIYSYSYENN
jgi:stage IV sporulation protein FB